MTWAFIMKSKMPLRHSFPVSPTRGTGPLGGTVEWGKDQLLSWSPVKANSDTQSVIERLIKALDKQGFKILEKGNEHA